MLIRDADEADIQGILEIYNHAVAHSTAIWNDTLVDHADRAAWLALRRASGFPVLVADDGSGAVLGYASYGPWRAFDGYRHTVEHSVYVREDCRGRGLGLALLRQLIARARGQGLHVMVAAIEAGNQPSLRLHEKLGFTAEGLLKEVGTKFGRWLDLAFLTLRLEE